MGFKGTPETERAIAQTVDALLTCSKSREDNLIRRLRGLWTQRRIEIGAVSTHSTRTTGPGAATAVNSRAPTESDTATTSTAAALKVAASEPTSPCGVLDDERRCKRFVEGRGTEGKPREKSC